MLQCTALTSLPVREALAALREMPGGPDDAEDHLADKSFVFCELGAYNDETHQHGTHLWTAEASSPQDLWFLWTASDGGLRIHHQFATLATCPAVLRIMNEGRTRCCEFHEGHPDQHSFHVEDPLKDQVHEHIRLEAQRRFSQEDPADDDEC